MYQWLPDLTPVPGIDEQAERPLLAPGGRARPPSRVGIRQTSPIIGLLAPVLSRADVLAVIRGLSTAGQLHGPAIMTAAHPLHRLVRPKRAVFGTRS